MMQLSLITPGPALRLLALPPKRIVIQCFFAAVLSFNWCHM
jgi:hypothetical protein